MSENNFLSLAATKELSAALQKYTERTGSSLENITLVAKVDKSLPTKMKRGGCCTIAQREKLEQLFTNFPNGVTMADNIEHKATAAEEIERRRDEALRRRTAHVERCARDHAARYGQETAGWVAVERMIA